jgi:hypothetical protein
MIKLLPSTEKDVGQIQQWTLADIYHNHQNNPEWWLTGNGLLSFKAEDETGPVFYLRMDGGDVCRLSVQFAPSDVVSKRRLIRAMLETLLKMIEVAKSVSSKGLVFDSSSPTLIKFMQRAGFKDTGNGSYVLLFGE